MKKLVFGITAMLCWLLLVYFINYLSPTFPVLIFFHSILAAAVFTTGSIFFPLHRRLLLWSIGVSLTLFMYVTGLATLMNIILLVAIMIALEIFLLTS